MGFVEFVFKVPVCCKIKKRINLFVAQHTNI
uniref:Uncharacterized protein n=1 Tax=Ciona intestinalis TaxID=7719 RepID=H2XVX9_CIOIN